MNTRSIIAVWDNGDVVIVPECEFDTWYEYTLNFCQFICRIFCLL